MSNLTDEETDRVLLQLIEQTAPERPTDEEAHAVVRWAEGVRIGAHILEMVLAGDATMRVVDGQPSFKLTPQGMAAAEELLKASPSARAFHDQLTADAYQKPLVKGPDETQ